jgi:hypothetical protein
MKKPRMKILTALLPLVLATAAALAGCATSPNARTVELEPAPQKKSGNWVFVTATSEPRP